LVVLYGILAFGTQPLIGLVVDYFKKPRLATLFGLALTGVALIIFPSSPLLFVVIVGFGNAIFHVGAGSIALNLTPKQATAPGIFVAPGAIGLLAGTLLGKAGNFTTWPCLIAIIIGAGLIIKLKTPTLDYDQSIKNPIQTKPWLVAIVLIFITILVRSFVGTALNFPWKSQMELLLLLTFAVFMGKALGGWLSDKYGWERIALGALLLSSPLLVFGVNFPVLAILGIFLFNFTMPVTLVALSNLFPGRPGFAFGITCFALLMGALPIFFNLFPDLTLPYGILSLIFLAVFSLHIALPLLKNFRK
jgi:FSR family fosmidomycin resistance protein-like MFS transporter